MRKEKKDNKTKIINVRKESESKKKNRKRKLSPFKKFEKNHRCTGLAEEKF